MELWMDEMIIPIMFQNDLCHSFWGIFGINRASDEKVKLLSLVKQAGIVLYLEMKSGFVNLYFSKSISLACFFVFCPALR